MANKSLFNTQNAGPVTTTTNKAGGRAYKLEDRHALAQLAVTGCLSNTFYSSAQDQLTTVLDLASKVDPVFVAKTAVYARRNGMMKDMPALLVAHLAVRDSALFEKVVPQVIDNGRMVRNLVQILRSGQLGRTTLPRPVRRFVRNWLTNRRSDKLLRDAVGNSPSIADVIKMVHPKPVDNEQTAMFAYLVGRDYKAEDLPSTVKTYEDFKAGRTSEIPNVEHRMLDSMPLTAEQWAEIARTMGFQALRMNLNTLKRKGVFDIPGMVDFVADRLRDPEAITRSRVLPYQLMTAYLNVADRKSTGYHYRPVNDNSDPMPMPIQLALQDALDQSLVNVPTLEGTWDVAIDISGSMTSTVTGDQRSKTTCVDVASLVGSALLHQNPNTRIWVFNNNAQRVHLNPRDTVMTNADKVRSMLRGGTDCASALKAINNVGDSDGIIMVSDNQSWMDSHGWGAHSYWGTLRGTSAAALLKTYHKRNKNAKTFLINIQPYTTTQAPESMDRVYNIGGFSDSVFKFIDMVNNSNGNKSFAALINSVSLDAA